MMSIRTVLADPQSLGGQSAGLRGRSLGRRWCLRLSPSLLLCLGISCGLGNPPEAIPSSAPPLLPEEPGRNIIVVSFDALRQDVLGAYGNTRGATPNMDRFAAQSLVFRQAYSVAPVTPTSFAAVFTGFVPTRVFHAWKLRAPSTLASRLSRAGYHTVAFMNNVQLTPQRGFDEGFDEYRWSRNDPDEQVLQRVETWLGEAPREPFFVWIHFLVPHAPYRAYPGASHLYRQEASGRFALTSGHTFETSDPEELARLRDLYLGEVWRADRLFGRLVARLDEVGLWDSSIVLLTSDHGEEFAEHGGFQHGRLYEEHLRVPLILRHPGVPEGRAVEARVRNVDLLPTLLASIGHPVHQALDGRVIPQPTSELLPPVIAISMTGVETRWASLTHGTEKLIVTCAQEPKLELYDLETDPGEAQDLAEDHSADVRRLLTSLRSLLGSSPCDAMQRAAQGRGATVGLDQESVEALRALGYVN